MEPWLWARHEEKFTAGEIQWAEVSGNPSAMPYHWTGNDWHAFVPLGFATVFGDQCKDVESPCGLQVTLALDEFEPLRLNKCASLDMV